MKDKESKLEKKLKTMDLILVIIGAFLFVFTIAMVTIYCATGGIPDTLVTCVFALCGCECGIMGTIENAKKKYIERGWQKEDEKNE